MVDLRRLNYYISVVEIVEKLPSPPPVPSLDDFEVIYKEVDRISQFSDKKTVIPRIRKMKR